MEKSLPIFDAVRKRWTRITNLFWSSFWRRFLIQQKRFSISFWTLKSESFHATITTRLHLRVKVNIVKAETFSSKGQFFYWPPSRHLSTQSRCRFLRPKPFVPFKMHYAVKRETFVTVEVLWREELKHYNRITQTICHNKDLTQSVRSLPGDRGTVFSFISGRWIMIECSLCWLIPENHPGVVLSKSMRQQ